MPDGSFMPVNTGPEELYRSFIRNYRVLDKVMPNDINQYPSLFFHDSVSYTFYDDPNFKPIFEPKLPYYADYSDFRDNMMQTCSDSVACQYDFILTLDPDFAKVTKEEETHAIKLANEAGKKC